MSFGLPQHIFGYIMRAPAFWRVMTENLTHHSLWASFRCPASPQHSWRCWWLPECRGCWKCTKLQKACTEGLGQKLQKAFTFWVEMRDVYPACFLFFCSSLCASAAGSSSSSPKTDSGRLCSSPGTAWWDFVWTEKVLGSQNHSKWPSYTCFSGMQIFWLTDWTLDRYLQDPAFCLFCPRVDPDNLLFGFPFAFGLLPVSCDVVEAPSRLTTALWRWRQGIPWIVWERPNMISVR